MKSNILHLVCALSFLFSFAAVSEEKELPIKSMAPEVVVTAERYPLSPEQVSSSVTVITAEQIEDSHALTIGDVLSGVPGVDVVQAGGRGGMETVFLRGANAEHTLVYIDGVEANDPIAATRTFDFANIGLENIERIEVIRGPQSVLYGSDAIGGVILITTKKGEGPVTGNISAEGGSFGTFNEQAFASGGDSLTHYSFSVIKDNSRGISSASSRLGNTEKDGHDGTNIATRFGITPCEFFDTDLFLRYANARTELDNFGGLGGDDPNRVIFDNNLIARIEAGTHLFHGLLNQKIGYSFTDQWFSDDNEPDSNHPFDSIESNYTGKMSKVDFQNVLQLNKSLSGVIGFENKTEQGSSSYNSSSFFGPFTDVLPDRSISSNGYYAQATYETPITVAATAGVRIDDHSKFGEKTTWKAGPVWNIGSTKLSGNIGTGYKAPSIFQLYSSYGNEDLKPEESKGWDVGIEREIKEISGSVGLTYFRNDFDNLITFDPNTFKSENVNEAESKGVESFISSKVSQNLSLNASYTFTETEDKTTGQQLLRRPKNKAKIGVQYKPVDSVTVGVDIFMRGVSPDNDFSTYPATTTDLAGYSTTAVIVTYKMTQQCELFVRGQNIFDKNYEDIFGFGTYGASAFGGFKYSFE